VACQILQGKETNTVGLRKSNHPKQDDMMRHQMHILFNNGVTVSVDVVDADQAGWSYNHGVTTLRHPAPDDWRTALSYADLSAVVAVWFTRGPE
jgi:hypothetical protein